MCIRDRDREELERMLSLGFIIPNKLFKTRQKSRMIIYIFTPVELSLIHIWTAKAQCAAYTDNGINGCFNTVPYTGNPAAGRYLLWAECSQQEPSGSRPEETD